MATSPVDEMETMGRAAHSERGPQLLSVQDPTNQTGLTDLPFQIAITDWEDLKPKHKKGVAEVLTSLVDMEDLDTGRQSRFVFRRFIPDDQHWGISSDRTLPLGIRVNGFDTDLGFRFASEHIHSRTIGTNQEHGHSLLHDAQASLAILNQDDARQKEQGRVTCTPGKSNLTGYSMGTMKLLAELGLAEQMGRTVDFSIGLDPCLVKRIDYQKELADAPELVKYLGSEALQVPVHLARNIRMKSIIQDLNRARQLASSIGYTPTYLSNLRDKWRVVSSGETVNFPQKVPKEAVVIIHFFDGCRWNNSDEYDRLFEGHENVRPVHEAGLHLAGADPAVMDRVVAKTVLGLKMGEEGVVGGELADALEDPILLAA
jgi:hypothetical protein